MDPVVLHSPLCSKSTFLTTPSFKQKSYLFTSPTRHHRLGTLHATGPAAGTGDGVESSKEDDPSATPTTTPSPPRPRSPPGTLNIRYRSKRQARRQQDETSKPQPRPPPVKKDWEEMTLGEKAVELYVGEKGLLFWLNKLAYASIFVIIGGWILFRFVGPSIGLYQLDAPPLSPSSVFKGSGQP